jgi:hypothetical protein
MTRYKSEQPGRRCKCDPLICARRFPTQQTDTLAPNSTLEVDRFAGGRFQGGFAERLGQCWLVER